MRVLPFSKREPFILFAVAFIFICFTLQSASARQSDRPFSLDLNVGGGLIGNSGTGTAFQPEVGFSYMPGAWGVGINAGLYRFDSGFSPDQYRTGFEEYTVSEQDDDRWRSFFINAGPRFEQNLSRIFSLKLGLDLSMNYQEGPTQSVRFNDPTGEMENAGFDTNIVLAQMDGSADAGWSTALRPQLQLEFSPGFSDRFSFNVTTGIQHQLSDREMTYSARDLSDVRPMDNVYEMHFQFDNAPVVQRTETAPRTNVFANAGIKIRFGKSSSRGLHPEGIIHRDIAARNPAATPATACPSSAPFRCPSGECVTSADRCPTAAGNDRIPADSGDCNDEGECPRPGDTVETAQDYNSSRSNRPRTEIRRDDRGGNREFVHEANMMARLINPLGTVVSAGSVTMSAGPGNPLHEETGETENPLYEGQASDGDSGDNNENDAVSEVWRYDMQPGSYCVSLSTMKISTNSQKGMRSGAQNHNSSRSNRTSAIANPDLNGGGSNAGTDSTTTSRMDAQNHNSSRSNRTSAIANPDLNGGGGNAGTDSTTTSRMDAQNHNSSRSNRTSAIANPDLNGGGSNAGTDSTMTSRMDAQNHNSSRSNRTSAIANPDLDTGDTGTDGQVNTRAIPPSIHGIAVDDPTNLKPDTDQNGFPEFMKSASFSISKRSARTGRSQSPIYEGDTNAGSNAIYQSEDALAAGGGDLDGDGYGDVAADGFHFELEIMASDLGSAASDSRSDDRGSSPNAPPGNQVAPSQTKVIVMGMTNNGDNPPSEESADTAAELDADSDEDGIPEYNDPDSDDDGLLDGLESATFSISDDSGLDIVDVIASRGGDGIAGTRSGGQENPLAVDEMEWVESTAQGVRPPNDVYEWTYKLSALMQGEDLPGSGTLSVVYTGGAWHFDVQFDPDHDGDGYGDLLRNSSFSISKRSARTGR
ncbi:hypothetical protein [Rhodohalobacter mucosus]|uniref:Uncharacterized protein n=1 Tax=Rhodohalobacter mucosus TaxID=2079485 RepID=A0A316TZT9_9BACT|nr:hypothetical protein [Rhodohalobacter mucosus]PWN05736.1 hypothetical protein DDZ15_14220 [Rhodohalobacter mucosus]